MTRVEKIANDPDLRMRANQMVGTKITVLRQDLLGLGSWKVGGYTFNHRQIFPGKRFSKTVWDMSINGKTVTIPYKYVLVLTYKALGLI